MVLYTELATMFHATEASPLVLGGVEFWIDQKGPWRGQLSFSKPTSQWISAEMAKDITNLSRCYPEVSRLIARIQSDIIAGNGLVSR